MKDSLPDRTVVIALIATLIIVFALIFSMHPNNRGPEPSLQWKDTQNTNINYLKA